MDDLLQDFIFECVEMLDALGSEIVAWEANPDDRARLDAIFRFVHTVKGNCGFLDLPRIEALSHAAEDALADVRAGRRKPDGQLVSAVLAIIDRIGSLVGHLERGTTSTDDDERLLLALAGAEPEPVADSAGCCSGEPARAAQRAVRLSVDLLDRLMSGVSDLVLARNELSRRMREAGAEGEVLDAFERVSSHIAEMREAITRTRMQRVENLFTSLPRMVRDLSRELGKKVLVDVDGGDVELDREMIEMIRDPLTHIVRNAVDHGIEPPDERLRAGKRETGLLRVAARQSGNQILIEILDDGRGIDADKLGRKSLAAGLLGEDALARLSPAAKLQLVFEPGLSTAEAVTSISGRGVGMDVVRANVERIGGVVELDSAPGQFTKLTLRVPLTLTIIPALTVSAGGQTFAIPRSNIEEIVRVGGQSVHVQPVGGAGVASIRGRRMALLDLAAVLGLAPGHDARTLVVLRPAGAELFALSVDAVHDHEELVVKPAAPAVMAAGTFAGTTLGDNGRPMLLLDAAGLAAAGAVELGSGRLGTDAASEPAAPLAQAVLFRALDGRRCALRLSVVERIEELPSTAMSCTGGAWRVSLDGRIVHLLGASAPPAGARLRIFRLDDGRRELAYAFDQVVDIIDIPLHLAPAADGGPIAGVFLHDEQHVELLDPLWLFGQAASATTAPVSPVAPVLVIPPGDRWLETMLVPLAEQAGYRVARGEGEAGDPVALRIVGEGALPDGAPVLRLSDQLGDGVYRYDRDAILQALHAHRKAMA